MSDGTEIVKEMGISLHRSKNTSRYNINIENSQYLEHGIVIIQNQSFSWGTVVKTYAIVFMIENKFLSIV